MKIYNVRVLTQSHANLDSLPLRFGIHFQTDQMLVLNVIKDMGSDPQFRDRFHVEGKFKDPTNPFAKEQFGHFVLAQKLNDRDPSLVTAWRNDRDTEWGLSTTMTNLRKGGFVTVDQLLEMHPLYIAGEIIDSASLVKHLSVNIAKKDVSRFEDAARRAREEAISAIRELERAREELEIERNNAEKFKAQASKANQVVTKQEALIAKQHDEIAILKAQAKEDEARYRIERVAAEREGSVATLSSPDTLVEVRKSVLVRGSPCTVLVMGDGRTLHMKTSTFDKDGSVTRKAESLVGARVRTTCWDPVGAPGKWSSQGYFRNIYLVE